MNREEAIVMWVIPALENTWNEKKCNEILDALEQEPCDDAISRKDLGLTDFEIVMCDGNYKEALIMLLAKIKEAPSVQPKQRTGRWISLETNGQKFPFWSRYKCSMCNGFGEGTFKHCPNCGAKMSESSASCSTCILDNTDACTRGAGRAVDDEACEDYLASPTGAEGSGKE